MLREGLRREAERGIPQKFGLIIKFIPREPHERALKAVEICFGRLVAHLQLFPNFVVEVLQQFLAGARHGFVDLQAQRL